MKDDCKDMLLSLKLQVPSECQIQVPRFPRFGYYLYTQIISATERAVIARTVKMSACKERSKWLLDWNPTISGSKQDFFPPSMCLSTYFKQAQVHQNKNTECKELS